MASSVSSSRKITLKLVIDKTNEKVVFAEAGKDFIDFLFHLMLLPVGTVISLLKEKGMAGSLVMLHNSIENFSDAYTQPGFNKDLLLKPRAPSFNPDSSLLFLNDTIDSSASKNYYIHGNAKCPTSGNGIISARPAIGSSPALFSSSPALFSSPPVMFSSSPGFSLSPAFGSSTAFGSACPAFSSSPAFGVADSAVKKPTSREGDYVKELAMYMVMDDLEVKPLSTVSCIALLNACNVKDVGALEEKVVELGMDEGIKLLQTSFQSKTVLTDVFLSSR